MSVRTIAWLPAHPAMGWASMNRCWHALDHEAFISPPRDLHIVCPLKLAPVEQPEAPSWRRQLSRHLSYPLHVKFLNGVDAVHVLDHSFADLLHWVRPNVKKIVTVHDIIPLLDSTGMTEYQVQRFRTRMAWLHQADIILCVSEFTKQSLIEQLKLDPSKLRVLPNGVEIPTTPGKPLHLEAPRPWLLLVGSNLERKNLQLVPEMLRHLQAYGIKPTILRIGPALKPEISMSIRSIIGDERLIELGLVSDDVLASAYASADMLFFPSTLEGFGLPVLEAVAHGCPVVCANSSSLPEVGGDAVLYFDPNGASDAATKVREATSNGVSRERLIKKGKERAAKMAWSKHFAQLCEVYREATA